MRIREIFSTMLFIRGVVSGSSGIYLPGRGCFLAMSKSVDPSIWILLCGLASDFIEVFDRRAWWHSPAGGPSGAAVCEKGISVSGISENATAGGDIGTILVPLSPLGYQLG